MSQSDDAEIGGMSQNDDAEVGGETSQSDDAEFRGNFAEVYNFFCNFCMYPLPHSCDTSKLSVKYEHYSCLEVLSQSTLHHLVFLSAQ